MCVCVHVDIPDVILRYTMHMYVCVCLYVRMCTHKHT